MTIFPSKSQLLTPGELAQMKIEEKVRKLRQMCPPPSWMDQSEEGVKKWRNL